MRFHLSPIRMAQVNNTGNSSCWRGCGAIPLLVGLQICTTTMHINMAVPQEDRSQIEKQVIFSDRQKVIGN